RVAKAFRAMKAIGISEDKVKPVLKSLLVLYEKNWTLIEEENYRALADAIFEREESVVSESEFSISSEFLSDHTEEAVATQEPERPLKRLRRNRETSTSQASGNIPTQAPLLKPKEEPDTMPETSLSEIAGSQTVAELAPTNDAVLTNPSTAVMSSDACNPSSTAGEEQNSQIRSGVKPSSHTMRLRDRGKGSVSNQVSSGEEVPGNSPLALCLKEPKAKPTANLPDKVKFSGKSIGETPTNAHKSGGRRSCTQDSSPLVPANENEAVDDVSVTRHEPRVGSRFPLNSEKQCSSLEIASSAYGEVKMLLKLDRIPEKTDFHVPDLEVFMKLADEKFLQSTESSKSVIPLNKIFADTCQCFLELGSSPNSLLPSDARENNGLTEMEEEPHGMAAENEGVKDGETCAEEAMKQPQLTSGSNGYGIDIAKGEENVVITVGNEVNGVLPPPFCYIPHNAVFQNGYVNFCLARIGDANCCASCSGDCLSSSIPCACTQETGGMFAYTKEGLVRDELLRESVSMNRDPKKHSQFFCKECPLERSKCEDTIEPCKGHLVRKFIKECWLKCGCSKQCGNRVVQRGITRNLQVFLTCEEKGWGLRSLEDLPKGAFVCEYVGEVLTNSELFERVSRSRKGDKHSYPVLLDADWCAEGALKDEEALCLDATHYGNVARFINHR
ncbi:hypothetical protein M569_05137, partial [Genlisea aurea]